VVMTTTPNLDIEIHIHDNPGSMAMNGHMTGDADPESEYEIFFLVFFFSKP
jgi:hypothetical protein